MGESCRDERREELRRAREGEWEWARERGRRSRQTQRDIKAVAVKKKSRNVMRKQVRWGGRWWKAKRSKDERGRKELKKYTILQITAIQIHWKCSVCMWALCLSCHRIGKWHDWLLYCWTFSLKHSSLYLSCQMFLPRRQWKLIKCSVKKKK